MSEGLTCHGAYADGPVVRLHVCKHETARIEREAVPDGEQRVVAKPTLEKKKVKMYPSQAILHRRTTLGGTLW